MSEETRKEAGSGIESSVGEVELENTSIESGKIPGPEEQTGGKSKENLDTSKHPSTRELNNLGWSHLNRFREFGTLNNLNQAIKYFSQAVAQTPKGHPDMVEWLTGLGVSYNDRFQRFDELADLENSIESKNHALKLTPEGHPSMAARHASLGMSYNDRYHHLGELADLDKAIAYNCRAIKLTPDSDPNIADRHALLGVFYRDRYQRLGELADLEKSLESGNRALILVPNDYPRMADLHTSLGVSYRNRYQRLGDLADLEKAIECHCRALELTPDGHPDMADRHASLGESYRDRYQRLGDLADLDKSLKSRNRALELTPNGHPHMVDRHGGLGLSYSDRYRRLGDLADLEKAIECRCRALELTPNGHPDMADRHAGLGESYRDRYQRLGDLADLDKSLKSRNSALELTPNGHQNMADRYAGLGESYRDQYRHLGKLADLEKAIECDCRALELTPASDPNLADRYASLGVSYRDRYQRLGELADLEKSLENRNRALELTPDRHPRMVERHVHLAESYSDRYRRLGDLADLEKSFQSRNYALTLIPDDHREMATLHAGLGVSYSDRYRRLGDRADLEKAIECNHLALKLTPESDPNIADLHAIVGLSYGDRYRYLGELADLEKAIEFSCRALALTSDGHPHMASRHSNLALSYRDRYQCLSTSADLEAAIRHSNLALKLAPNEHPSFPLYCFNYALNLFSQYQCMRDLSSLTASLDFFRTACQLLTGSPRDKFQFALRWANLSSEYELLNPVEAYQATINLLPQYIWLGATTNQRYQDLSQVESLAVKACFAAIQSSSYSLALEWLEHARCVVWSQSLALRAPLDDLHILYPKLAARLTTVANQLHSFSFEIQPCTDDVSTSTNPEQAGRERRRLAAEYHSLLSDIRHRPEFEDFLQPLKSNKLMRAARYGPVVALGCHGAQCVALIILPGHDSIAHIPLSNFTEKKARQARSDLKRSLIGLGLRERGIKRFGGLKVEDCFQSVLAVLWADIVEPILRHLGYMNDIPSSPLPHITWCPTGVLSFLPLHAAGDYTQPRSQIFNYVVSSYTPTLTVLLSSPPQLLSRETRILAIGQAITPGHKPLPGTVQELAHIQAHTQNKVEYSKLINNQATRNAVLDAMDQHDWVHLACHAHQNFKDPTMSGFFLHDGTLDLSEINRRSFKNKGLAFLSACQTATGDEGLPDEAIHLASGMLMAGYPSVIATMWSVVDDDAPFVADKVYAQLMKDGRIGKGEAGQALHHAVAGLREKVGEKEFGRWVPYIHIGS